MPRRFASFISHRLKSCDGRMKFYIVTA